MAKTPKPRDTTTSQQEDYKLLFNMADTAVAVLGMDGALIDYNCAFAKLLGYNDDTAAEYFHPGVISPQYQPDGTDSFVKSRQMIETVLAQGAHGFEWMHKSLDGREFLSYVLLEVITFMGKQALCATVRDISEQRKLERLVEERTRSLNQSNTELKRLVETDPLTGLYNRLKLDDVLRREQSRYERMGREYGLALIDIDFFKNINDQYGHAIGDKVLREVSRHLQRTTRAFDAVARWGGEEFVIVFPETDLDQAAKAAEKLRQSISNSSFNNFNSITVSIGVAIIQQGESIDSLFSRADKALYCAKKSGRNRVETA